MEFKVKRKQNVVEELRARVYSKSEVRQERYSGSAKKLNHAHFGEEPEKRSSPQFEKSSSYNQRRPPSSKPVSQLDNLTHLTPTFPSNELELKKDVHRSGTPRRSQDGEAFNNIEKLIQRYEKIKSKDKIHND